MGNLPLFDEPPSFDRAGLHRKLDELARQRIYIGTSSWKYQGWFGQIYTPDRYYFRGRLSEKRFQDECLAEYAETFPIVCGDFTFYQFPAESYWKKLFNSAPGSLRFAFKVPEETSVKVFPKHARYGPRAGDENESFLNSDVMRAQLLDVLQPWRERIATLIIEFGQFPKFCYKDVAEFIAELDPFLKQLPTNFRYAVEVRNEEFLCPEYFACLRHHGVAHVLNAWTRMPDLSEQIEIPEIHTADFTVVRALLRRGRPYEQAVKQFSPYREVQEANPGARDAIRTIIKQARERNQPSYIFVNNRLEGNAPQTIESIIS